MAVPSGLLESLGIGCGGVVALTGGGGKTSLMWALARAGLARGWRVLTTTTTRIWPPRAGECACTLLLADDADPAGALRRAFGTERHVSAGSAVRADGKLGGLAPSQVDVIAAARLCELIVVEADGAAGRPLKGPREDEPVVPACATLAVLVVGIDALDAPLDDAHVHRAALAAGITGLAPGEAVTADAIAALLVGPRGLMPRIPAQVPVTALVNKVEDARARHAAQALARCLLDRGAPRLARALIGGAQRPEAGFSVLER